MDYQSIKLLNQMEAKQKYDNIILRRKRNAVIARLILAFCLGMATMWLAMADKIDQAADEARMSERASMVLTLTRCARTQNYYVIPGTDLTVKARIRPKGLRIVSVEKGRALAADAGK